MEIDHIGYAVKDIQKARESFERLGFQFEDIVEDFDRNVYISFGNNGGYRVELIAPLDRTKKSNVDTILKKMGALPYHLCYRVDDLEKSIEEFDALGFHLLTEPAKAVALGGRRVAFLFSGATGMIELLENRGGAEFILES